MFVYPHFGRSRGFANVKITFEIFKMSTIFSFM